MRTDTASYSLTSTLACLPSSQTKAWLASVLVLVLPTFLRDAKTLEDVWSREAERSFLHHTISIRDYTTSGEPILTALTITRWTDSCCRKKQDRRARSNPRLIRLRNSKAVPPLEYSAPSILCRCTMYQSEKEMSALVHAGTTITGMILCLCARASAR